ncbi:MAG: cation diffusion facilitator family transporter [Candidatus Omnitrophota bacterium]
MDKRSNQIKNILLLILGLNWLVALAKIIYGYKSSCYSMAADGFHSFADGASNIIGLIGIVAASRPADEDHPYGHKKFETLATIAIATLLFLISFNLIEAAVARFKNPHIPQVNIASFVVMILTTAVNFFVYAYERNKSEQLNSDILLADSEHTRSDILVSISVILTLFAIKGGFPILDTIVAFIIAFLIGKAGIDILRCSFGILCDKAVIAQNRIREIVMQVADVKGCHNIRTRGRTDDVHVDLHILVDMSMHVSRAHSIAEEIEEKIKKVIAGVNDVVVHIEPDKPR